MVDIVGEIMYVNIDQWKLTNFAQPWALHINIIFESMYQHECLFNVNNIILYTILKVSQGRRTNRCNVMSTQFVAKVML